MQKLLISRRGLDLIKCFESFSATVYLCPAGKPTIGYGHVVLLGERFDQAITEAHALEILADDCRTVEIYLNAVRTPVPLTQNQFDALVSLIFNIGIGAFDRSTLLKLLKAGDVMSAADQFTRWNKSRGRVLPGLVKRRAEERALFLET